MHLWLAGLLIAVMGLVLGLLGGGGSILTVPILVYALGIEAHAAIPLSLVLVGSTAVIAALLHQQQCHIAWKQGLLFVAFGIPLNLLGTYASRRASGALLLVLFGVLMGAAGIAMLIKRNNPQESSAPKSIWPVVVSGVAVGFLAGFLGVGGGFLIVPSLVLFLGMPMKSATGTSLLIIAANSVVGLFGHRTVDVGWNLVLYLVPLALLGTFLGVKLTNKFSGHQLRKAFGMFIIVLGIFMIANNTAALFKH